MGLDRVTDRGRRAVRRPQPHPGRLQESRRSPVPAERLPPLRASGSAARATGSATRMHMQRFGRARRDAARLGQPHLRRRARSACSRSGAGGLDVALAMAGRAATRCPMPEVWGVRLTGPAAGLGERQGRDPRDAAPPRGATAATGAIIEYYGPGVATLTAMDRHVIANMGAELGATTTVFPADEETRRFLAAQGREDERRPLAADDGRALRRRGRIDLGRARASDRQAAEPRQRRARRARSPGPSIYQAYIGSSANPGFRDFAIAALIVRGEQVALARQLRRQPDLAPDPRSAPGRGGTCARSSTPAPGSTRRAATAASAWARRRRSDRSSLRTVPRNFPGRSRHAGRPGVPVQPGDRRRVGAQRRDHRSARARRRLSPRAGRARASRPTMPRCHLPRPEVRARSQLVKGPNIGRLPELDPLPDRARAPGPARARRRHLAPTRSCPAGSEVLPYRSNIPAHRRVLLRPGRPRLSRSGPPRGGWSRHRRRATTTARARAASTRHWRRATSGCGSCWRAAFARIHRSEPDQLRGAAVDHGARRHRVRARRRALDRRI